MPPSPDSRASARISAPSDTTVRDAFCIEASLPCTPPPISATPPPLAPETSVRERCSRAMRFPRKRTLPPGPLSPRASTLPPISSVPAACATTDPPDTPVALTSVSAFRDRSPPETSSTRPPSPSALTELPVSRVSAALAFSRTAPAFSCAFVVATASDAVARRRTTRPFSTTAASALILPLLRTTPACMAMRPPAASSLPIFSAWSSGADTW